MSVNDIGQWNVPDLVRRLSRTLELAATALDCFGVEGFVDDESPAYSFGPEKVIAESTMLAFSATGASSFPQVRDRLDALIRLLVPLARSERMLAEIALQPALAPKFALPHALLTRMGHTDIAFDNFVRDCLRSDVGNGHDRSPTAAAEYAWLCSRWPNPEFEQVRHVQPARSLLDCQLDVFEGLRDDAYAYTHLVFYSTDFGFSPRGLERRKSQVLAMAEALLVRYLDAEDYDITGELLLTWPLTGARWSSIAAFTFRVLARVENEAGLLPCGRVDSNRLQRLTGEAQTRYALGMAYHTAFVMGILCAASLVKGRLPPTAITGRTLSPTVFDRIYPYLDTARSHWQSDFATLSGEEQLILTPLLLAVALVRQCRRRDYASAKDLLRLAEKHGQAGMLVCCQASQLLARIAGCSTALRAKSTAAVAGVRG